MICSEVSLLSFIVTVIYAGSGGLLRRFNLFAVMFGVGEFPKPRAGAVGCRKDATQVANKHARLVVMVADGHTLVVGELETEPVEYVNATVPMAAAVAACGLAEVVEQSRHHDAVVGVSARVCKHVFIHFKGMLGKAAVPLVVAVAAACEVIRILEVVDYGFDAVSLRLPEDCNDLVLSGHNSVCL